MRYAFASLAHRVKQRIGPLWWYGALNFGFNKLGDLINLYVGVFLVPALITPEDLGAIVPFRMIIALAGLPMVQFTTVALKFINAFHVDEDKGLIRKLLRDLSVAALLLSAIAWLILWGLKDFIQLRMKVADVAIFWILAATAILTFWQPIVGVVTQGVMRFRELILSSVVRPLVYLVLILVLLKPLRFLGYLTASLGASVAVLAYLGWTVREYLHPRLAAASYREHLPEMRRYLLNAGTVALLMAVAALVEPWTIRNFAPMQDSAGFYMAFVFGQIPGYLAAAFLPFLFPLMSERVERGQSAQGLLLQALGVTLLAGAAVIVVFAAGAGPLFRLRASWRVYLDYAPYVWRLGVISMLDGLIATFLAHENAHGRFAYVKVFLPILAIEIVGIYCLMGWDFFRPHLPAAAWQAVNQITGHKLSLAIYVMLVARLALVVPAACLVAGLLRRGASDARDSKLET